MNALVVGDEAEPVTANYRSVLHDDARADDRAVANRDARVKDRVVADLRFGADNDVRVEDDAIADHGLRADDHERADRDVTADARVRRDDSGRVHASGWPLIAPEQREGLGKRAVRMRGAQHRARCRRGIFGQDDRRGARRPSGLGVARVGQERQVARTGLLQAGDAHDVDLAIAFEAGVQPVGQVAKLHGKSGLYHWAVAQD